MTTFERAIYSLAKHGISVRFHDFENQGILASVVMRSPEGYKYDYTGVADSPDEALMLALVNALEKGATIGEDE